MNQIELTDYKIAIKYKLNDYQLDELLNELLDEMILWKDENSIFKVHVYSWECGDVLDNHIPEEHFQKILDYCEKNFTDTPLRIERKTDWGRKPRKKGSEYMPKHYYTTTADDIERQQVEGGDIQWKKIYRYDKTRETEEVQR